MGNNEYIMSCEDACLLSNSVGKKIGNWFIHQIISSQSGNDYWTVQVVASSDCRGSFNMDEIIKTLRSR
jgi:hypothetical protein